MTLSFQDLGVFQFGQELLRETSLELGTPQTSIPEDHGVNMGYLNQNRRNIRLSAISFICLEKLKSRRNSKNLEYSPAW